jgi:hypothetical protein
MTIEARFVFEKETKGAVRYQEVDESGPLTGISADQGQARSWRSTTRGVAGDLESI